MAISNTYLNFNGNTEEAFNFYKSVFGGEFTRLVRFKEIPGNEKMSAEDQEKLMHISLPIGGKSILMATDCLSSMGLQVSFGNNSYISLHAESEAEAEKLFYGLSADGQIEMPLENTFWGAYFGSFKDKYGVAWMVEYEYPKA